MKFKIDENLPSEFAVILQDAGFDAETVADEDLSGAADGVLARHARSTDRVLITLDMDFANIQSYPPASPLWHGGVSAPLARRDDVAGLAPNSHSRPAEVLP